MTCKDYKCQYNRKAKCQKGKDKIVENTIITCPDSENYKNITGDEKK